MSILGRHVSNLKISVFFLFSGILAGTVLADFRNGDNPVLNLDPMNISGSSPGYISEFREKNDAVNITSPDAAVEDITGNGLTEIRIRLNPTLPDDFLLAETEGTDMLAVYADGILRITGRNIGGRADAESYQDILRTAMFTNESLSPDTSPRTIEFTPYDGEMSGETAICTLSVTAVNDPPVNTVPGPQFTPRDVPLFFSPGNGNRISVSDPDAGDEEMTADISADRGEMSVNGTSGAFIGGNHTSNLSIRGKLSEINEDLSSLRYAPQPGWIGNLTLTFLSDDLGHSGIPGSLTDSSSIPLTVGIPGEEKPPVADAGPDQTVEEHSTVHLDGSASYAPDGIITEYAWTQISGMPKADLADADTAHPFFTAPESGGGNLVFQLNVKDSNHLSDSDTVTVAVIQKNPPAEGGTGDTGGCFLHSAGKDF